jgi:hypothetical protein
MHPAGGRAGSVIVLVQTTCLLATRIFARLALLWVLGSEER